VQGMLPVKRAKLFKFQLLLSIPPVLLGGIVPSFAFATLKRDKLYYLFLTRHK